jgi:hypothetical protein
VSDLVRQITDAVLYEGYLLWPYRRSAMKNTQRWTFGGVFPPAWSAAHPDDRCEVRATVDSGQWTVDVSVRFLQVVHRQVLLEGEPVDAAGGVLTWDEAVEREVGPGPFAIDAGSDREELGDGVAVVRSWHALRGAVEVDCGTVAIRNETPWTGGTREEALESAFCSLHAVLRAEAFGDERSGDGLWPVLIDDGVVLASPIILEDRPKIAPESPGDLFDGGEIDELLVLNILSLTDEEKDEMRATDPRAREILERTEGLSQDQLLRLHGRLVR